MLNSLVAMMVLIAAQISAPKSQPAAKAPSQASQPSQPRISDSLLTLIQQTAVKDIIPSFSGLMDYANGSGKLHVISARALIALKTKEAAESGGKYTPSAPDRADILMIDCGDSDLGDIFECSRVRVLTPSKRIVQPLAYAAQRNTYHNAMGARWAVREVTARYPIRDLRDGFSVEYADFSGTGWTFVVSADDARDELLLKLDAAPSK
jgi:hypothetical protein